jgi:serine/threonine-protein kinase
LLTGKEPQDLFDDTSLNWKWQQFTTVSPGLAKTLNRMLSYKPAKRFPNAEEVLQALQEGAYSSELKTVAVGRQATTNTLAGLQEKTVYAPSNPPPKRAVPSSRQGQSGGINIFLGTLLVLISGIASWAIASVIFDRSKLSQPVPSANNNNNSSQTTTAPTRTPSEPSLTNINKSLNFNTDTNRATINDKISAGQSVTYRLNGKKGQKMTTSLTGPGLQMTLNFEDQKPIDSRANNISVGYWQGKLPANGAYFVVIKTTPGVSESNFSLDVQLETPATPTPKPTPTASASPTPTENPIDQPTPNSSASPNVSPQVTSRNIEFPPGNFITPVAGTVGPNQIIRYRVGVLDGQTLGIRVTEGNVKVEIIDPEGNLVGNIDGGGEQQITATRAGNYKIRVTSDSETSFSLDLFAK